MEADDSFDYLFKIVLIGDMGVGKTCVVQRFKNGTFIEKQGATIGVDFTMKTLIIDGKKVKLQIWYPLFAIVKVFEYALTFFKGIPAARNAFEQLLKATIARLTESFFATTSHVSNHLNLFIVGLMTSRSLPCQTWQKF